MSLSADVYCLFKTAQTGEHFGIIEEAALDMLIDAISGESLQNLEYLDHEEFKERMEYDSQLVAGNDHFLQRLSYTSSN